MDEENNACAEQEINEEDSKITPERQIRHKGDDVSDSNHTEIKTEPEDCCKSEDRSVVVSDVQLETNVLTDKDFIDKEQIRTNSDTDINASDVVMTLVSTTVTTSNTEAENTIKHINEETKMDIDEEPQNENDTRAETMLTDSLADGTATTIAPLKSPQPVPQEHIPLEKEILRRNYVESSNETTEFNQSPSSSLLSSLCNSDALDDGIATPIAPLKPRLKVKTEFSLIEPLINQQQIPLIKEPVTTDYVQCNNDANKSAEFDHPAPAPLLSSTSNLTALTDGIATPIAPLKPRLRVKTEFSLTQTIPQQQIPLSKESVTTDYVQSDNDLNKTTEFNHPPPPQLLSSICSSDALADGIATPIAPTIRPRLRVKTEFSSNQLDPQQIPLTREQVATDSVEYNNDSNKSTEFHHPPPPPLLSSLSNSDALADGIATPRLSLAALSRSRVKTEFSVAASNDDEDVPALPQDYLDEFLNPELGEVTPNSSDAESQSGHIPEHFWDGIPSDKVKEKIEEAQNIELEEKYSDRLKELESLQEEEKRKERRKNHKKQKKSKKKSHKRFRDPSPPILFKDRKRHNLSPIPTQNKRHHFSPSFVELPSTSNSGLMNKSIRIKSEFQSFDIPNEDYLNRDLNQNNLMLLNPVKVEPLANYSHDIEVLTSKQKRNRALERASALITLLDDAPSECNSIFSRFNFVSTVRKLPASHSYVQQKIYENRSPLHTVNNVSYKFNSHSTRFNMEEWGLAALPTHAAKIAKLVGCDAQFIHDKLKTIKIPAKLKKSKQVSNIEPEEEEKEGVNDSTSSLYCNVMTQTDDVREFGFKSKTVGYEIGVQVEPSLYSIGCQTLETQSPTKDSPKGDDDIPLMKIIRDLNENQLMALHDFAELIREPANNAMDMYKLRVQMVEIYKISQMPSALAAPQSQVMNNYTTASTHSSPPGRTAHQQIEKNQLPMIQSVRRGDGLQFSVNDPRSKSSAYARRIITNNSDSAGSSSNYDSRHTAFVELPHSRFTSNEARHYSTASNTSPSSQRQQFASTKFYGRGAARR